MATTQKTAQAATRQEQLQTNFTAGVFSPLLRGRVDLAKYKNALAAQVNFISLPHGPLEKRAGSRFVKAVKTESLKTRVFDFIFSTEQAYVIEMGNEYLRFLKDEGQIVAPDITAAITNGTFNSDITGWTDDSTGSASIAHNYLGAIKEGTYDFSTYSSRELGDGVINRKHSGLLFLNAVAGTVVSVKIKTGTLYAGATCTARLFTDASASPGTQVGGDSDPVVLVGSTVTTFTWSSNEPSLSASTSYWVVLSDTGVAGDCAIETVADQGASFASGYDDTVTAISDASNGFPSGEDWKIEILVRPDTALNVLSLVATGSDVAIATQSVSSITLSVDHVLAFRVIGAVGDSITLRIGSSSGGTDIVNDEQFYTGWHLKAFNTPNVTTVHIQFRNSSGKTISIDDVSILDGVPIEIGTPYATEYLFQIKYIQSADTVYLCHHLCPIYKLTRSAHNSWSFTEYDSGDGPYNTINTGATTITPSGTSGVITLTASADLFTDDFVGRLVRLEQSAKWGACRISAVASSVSATAFVIDDDDSAFENTSATSSWRLGSWYIGNYPGGKPTFFDDRLVFCNTPIEPNAFYASRSSDFESHKPTGRDGVVADDHAINRLIQDNRVNAIYWLAMDDSAMFAGTSDGPFKIWSGQSGQAFAPSAVKRDKQTRDGCADLDPIEAGDALLYISYSTLKMRELSFNFERDKHLSSDLSLLSEHITTPGIAGATFAAEPDGLLYVYLTDGNAVIMTYKREEEVVAWSNLTIGGTAVEVESMTTIPSMDGTTSSVYMIVKRTINGATHRYIEFFENKILGNADTEKDDYFFVDSGLTYDGSPATVITGLDHLEGETVTILADGSPHDTKVVASGQITLDRSASVVQAGLGYSSSITTLPRESATATGTAQGKLKRIRQLFIRLYKSLGGTYGRDSSNQRGIVYRTAANPLDASPPLFTGPKLLSFEGASDGDAQITFQHDEPLPFTLVCVGTREEIQKA
jgi:hypothetical protein